MGDTFPVWFSTGCLAILVRALGCVAQICQVHRFSFNYKPCRFGNRWEALRGQIEDFFRVRWEAVVLMLIVVAGLIDLAYVRIFYGAMQHPPYWGVHTLLQTASFLLVFSFRRLFR